MPREVRRGSKSQDDVAACRAVLARGSKSFAMAARLLPERTRSAATVIYAFCRVADDAIDDDDDPRRGHARVCSMLDRVWCGRPNPDPIERALTRVAETYELPRAPFDALLEGFAWDAEGRELVELDDVLAYSVRVAASVGVVLTIVMGLRSATVLARACDLGVAMQLTNIARDVGEDARRGRVYLPSRWLDEAGLSRAALLAAPRCSSELASVVQRVLGVADELYVRADGGIAALPADCRPAIRAARLLYAEIGRAIRRRDYDSLSGRAQSSIARRIALLVRARWASSGEHSPGDALPLAVARPLLDAAVLS
ncbi:MAG TPA: phytoene/squalene synthase family protein [Nannocystaceae bacterium]|nr:phytoene/squalene synthase family protein [Nannocystaceae bacterium]